MLDHDQLERRTEESAALLRRFGDEGVRFAQMEMPDINGTVRGKIVPLKKALAPYGTGISTGMVAARSADELVATPFSSVEAGLPKMVALPDYATLKRWSWRPDMAAILCALVMEDGRPCPMDARHILKSVARWYEDRGLEPRVAYEIEVYVYEADDTLLREKRYRELKTFGRGWDFYSITRFPSFEGLAKTFMERMASLEIEVEAVHTELGHGMLEFTLAPQPALRAADEAVRAKLYFKQLCDEFGLVASFMSVINLGTGDSASGCHHNFSLWREGRNALWDANSGGLSPLARKVAAGVLATMPDFHLVFRPWVNSYRRMDRWLFSPENASWAVDNHSVALRVVHGAYPEKLTRLEHRVSGTDINPYLTLAAILLGGRYGIDNDLDPGCYSETDPALDPRFKPLARSYPESIAAFKSSALVRALLGDAFTDHYAVLKEDEWRDFSTWARNNGVDPAAPAVTDWEFLHYFIWV